MSMALSAFGGLLNAQYEIEDKDGDGEPDIQTEAYQDSLGYWTGPGGIRWHANGAPVREGDTWTEQGAWRAYATTLDDWVEDVLALCTLTPNQFQLDALVLLAWNIGIDNLRTSTVLRCHNEGRFEDAAAAFGMWVYGTRKPAPDVVGPDGEPLRYDWKRAKRGLYRRHLAEACLYLGYDWELATANHRIELEIERTDFQADRARWIDRVGYRTPWSEVLAVARQYPLEDPDASLFEDLAIPRRGDPASAETAGPPDNGPGGDKPAADPESTPIPEPLPPVLETAPVNTIPQTKPPSVWTVKPDAVPYKIDPEAGLKPLEDSDRAKGYVWQSIGRGVVRAGSLGMFGTTFSGLFDFLQSDAVLYATFMELFVPAAVALSTIGSGFALKAYGDWKRARGEEAASQGLF